jgi:S1-C subfamily serine protease
MTTFRKAVLNWFVVFGLVLLGCIGVGQVKLLSSAVQEVVYADEEADVAAETGLTAQSGGLDAQEANVPTETVSTAAADEPVAVDIRVTASEDQIIALYKAASPSVVNVTSVQYVYARGFGTLPEEGVGSGFVYDSEGHIVTNYHVIENADELIVTFATGEEYEAVVVGKDAVNDLAVLYVDAGDNLPPPLSLADSGEVQVGETVLAIGNPYGLDGTLTTGVVSALGRVIESAEEDQFIAEAIQTDAAINPGNSGGPLLNTEGEVIGVNSQIISNSGSSAGVGFAISANTVRVVVPELIAKGVYLHPWLGVEGVDLTAYSVAVLSEAGMNIPVETGVLVVGIEAGSPAEAAGLSVGDRQARFGRYVMRIGGDIITAVDDTPVETLQDLMLYVEMQTSIGDTVQLTVIRDGAEQIVPVTLRAQQTSN